MRGEKRGPQRPGAGRLARIRKTLLAWFARARRDLPWRRDRDPYRVWVSEVMLQQTRADVVAPYFERFTARFPDVAALAAAPLEEVLEIWQGLGYYGRARNLHRAAHLVVARHGGELPPSLPELRRLPGVGPYMAGAIASIAFDLPAPAVDGNAGRVLARLFCVRDTKSPPQADPRIWALAKGLLATSDGPPGPDTGTGALNQALMELGARVCLPRNPLCPRCPVKGLCLARARGLQEAVPPPARRRPPPAEEVATAFILRRGKLLLARRKEGGRFGGLWELPGRALAPGDSPARALAEVLGIALALGPLLARAERVLSHRRLRFQAFLAEAPRGRPRAGTYAALRWVRPEELPSLPISSAQRALLGALRENSLPPPARAFFDEVPARFWPKAPAR